MKIAIVGTGKVARANYLPYLAAQADVALRYFSRTREKAQACANEFGGTVAGSVEELLADAPDAVLVLTMETQRAEAVRALLNGPVPPRRLFFEKPLVAKNGQANVVEDDFFQARELLQRAKAVGAETAMVFNYRFFDQSVRARQIVAERDFGRLTQASLFVNYACWSHCIDLLHLFGGPAATVSGISSQVSYQGAVDVAGAFTLENGATGTILGTSATRFDYPLYEMLFHFERGLLRFTDLDGPLTVWGAGNYVESQGLMGHRSRWDQYRKSFETAMAAYLDSVRQGAPPPVPGSAGLDELQFEVALRRAVAQRRTVEVAREFAREG